MRNRKLSIRLIWMGAYIAVVIVMCIVFLLGTVMVKRTIKENAVKVNTDKVVFMQNSLDDTWDRVFKYSLQIISNSKVKALENAAIAQFKTQDTYGLSLEFKNYTLSNTMVEDLYLYYPSKNYIIGINGVYPSQTYWASLYGTTKTYSSTTWMNEMFGNRKTGYFTVKNGNQPELYYRMSAVDITGRILVVKINTEELKATLDWICNDNENSFLGMVDDDNYIYAYSGNNESFVDPDRNQLLDIDEKNYLLTRVDSNIQTLDYVVITDRNLAYRQVDTVMHLALVFLLVAFVCGVGASIFFVRQTAQPVYKLKEKLEGADSAFENELQYIDKQIDELKFENKQALESVTRHQNMMVQRSFLNECLKFKHNDNEKAETIAAIHGLAFENSYYRIIIRERTGSDSSARIINLLEEEDNSDCLVCWTQRQDLDVFLTNYDEECMLNDFLAKLRSVSSNTSAIIVGRATGELEDIRSEYLDCLQQLGRKEVVMLTHANEAFHEFENLKGQSILASFQKYLSNEDYTGARQLIPELCATYLGSMEYLEKECGRHIIVQMLLNQKSKIDLRSPLLELIKEDNVEQFERKLTDLLIQCSHWKLQHQQSDKDIAGKIRCVVDEMYADPLLSLHMISEEVEVSESYVSRMFKKKYGIGVTQYINQVRIAAAKKQIQESTEDIKVIAMRVGFSSDVQFIRAFKKLEGITPGTFRAECMAENE